MVRPSVTRRGFLQGLAATSFAAPVIAQKGIGRRIVVVGAGAFGTWTAWHLRRAGYEVTLFDAWGPGNSRSSSGGESRVIRAIYGPDRIYVEMVRRAFELWDELEDPHRAPIYEETGALWMLRVPSHPYLEGALPILEELGFPTERPTVAEARGRWPQIDFSGVESVLLEKRAGVLSSRRSVRRIRDHFIAAGGTYRTARVEPVEGASGRIGRVRLAEGGSVEADAFVFACGPWLGQLFPEAIGDAILPSRQDVLYFGTPPGTEAYGPERLPVWIDFGGERIFYGLPDVHGRGFKLADDTRGDRIDPTRLERSLEPSALRRARGFLAERFPGLATAPLVESRVCQYENSPEGDLVLGRLPGLEDVWVAGGGSGHGFKLSPVVGEMMAKSVAEGQEPPKRFAPDRLTKTRQGQTQFDAGQPGVGSGST